MCLFVLDALPHPSWVTTTTARLFHTPMGYHSDEETRAGVQGTLAFSFVFIILTLITTNDAAPVWGSHTLRARRDTYDGFLCVFDAITHPLSMQRHPSQVSLHARCRLTPFEHRDTHDGCLFLLEAIPQPLRTEGVGNVTGFATGLPGVRVGVQTFVPAKNPYPWHG